MQRLDPWLLGAVAILLMPNEGVAQAMPTFRSESTTVRSYDGRTMPAEFVSITVPERRAQPGRTVTVAALRLSTTADDPGRPVVFLMGGPGIPGSVMARVPPYFTLFQRLREALSQNTPLRKVEVSAEQGKILASFGLLTRKPVLIVFNMGEGQKAPVWEFETPSVPLQGKPLVIVNSEAISERCDEPLGYYHRLGPAGQVFATLGRAGGAEVGVVGLGSGGLSAYAEPGQRWTYFEIDPAVVRIASNPDWFCTLRRSPVRPRVLLGDARLSLTTDTTRYDILVLDAYTSDAVPVHLLTREAFRQYFERIRPGGVLALHISNRHFDIEKVVARIAHEAGFAHRVRVDGKPTKEEAAGGMVASSWAVLAREEKDLGPLSVAPKWRKLRLAPESPLWTDDYSSLVSVLK